MHVKEQTFILQKAVERNLSRLVAFVSALPNDRAWKVTIGEWKPRRSDSQNRYLWGAVYPAIMQQLEGWEAADVHEYCLGEWAGWEEVEGFGRLRLRPIRRSSKLTKMEFVDYVAFIQRHMAQHGIFIPDPES